MFNAQRWGVEGDPLDSGGSNPLEFQEVASLNLVLPFEIYISGFTGSAGSSDLKLHLSTPPPAPNPLAFPGENARKRTRA